MTQSLSEQILAEIEAHALALKLSPHTIARMGGQSGEFIKRCRADKDMRRATAARFRDRLSKAIAERKNADLDTSKAAT